MIFIKANYFKTLCTLILILLNTASAIGQTDTFKFYTAPLEISSNGSTMMKNSTVGGLNTPQFGMMHLNKDTFLDLVIFDRDQSKFSTFINNGKANSNFEYAPYYETFLPSFHQVVIIRDFDRDGKRDLLGINSNQDLFIYKNITQSSDKGPRFKKLYDHYYRNNYAFGDTYNGLTARKADYPIVGDVDGDGDMDMIKYETTGSLGYYVNKEVEQNYTNGDSLLLEYSDICWGSFIEKTTENSIVLGGCGSIKKYRHFGGSALLQYDFDNDGDMEVLMSNSGYNDAVYIENGKKDFSYPYDTAISANTSFPPSHPINATIFPHFFMEDMNNDGKLDLIVAPGADVDFKDANQLQVYLNTGSNALPNFAFPDTTYMSKEMLDLGSNSAPSFWDYDNDGDDDLFIVSTGIYTKTLHKADRVSLYENDEGKFTLLDIDYAKLSTKGFTNLVICFGDVDNDGITDLVYGLRSGDVGWMKNTGTLGAPGYSDQGNILTGNTFTATANPFMYDINGDNLDDLIVGYFRGNISYYTNAGGSKFTFVTDSFGRVHTNYLDNSFNPPALSYEGYAAPRVVDLNNDGILELISGAVDGKILAWEIDAINPFNAFKPFPSPLFTTNGSDTVSYNSMGLFSIPAFAKINQDTILDMVVGLKTGGLRYFIGDVNNYRKNVSIDDIKKREKLVFYPNPVQDNLTVFSPSLNHSFTVKIVNPVGQVILNNDIVAGTNSVQLNMKNLQAGTYYLVVRNNSNKEQLTEVLLVK